MAETPVFSCAEQNRNIGCKCGAYNPFVSNVVVMILLFFLGWKILEINNRFKSLTKCCIQLERNLIEGGRQKGYLRCLKGSPREHLGDSKMRIPENLASIGDCTTQVEGESGIGSPCCKNVCRCSLCDGFLIGRSRNGYYGDRMQDLIENKNENEETHWSIETSDDTTLAEIDSDQRHEHFLELDYIALKKAITKEQGYRAAAYLELDKERRAAASAAHEAMMMILRLQNEKSLIELQAQQYQREARQRRLYDQEMIMYLKETISKQELERQALENEPMRKCGKTSSNRSLLKMVSEEGKGRTPSQFSPIAATGASQVSGGMQPAEANDISEDNNELKVEHVSTDTVTTWTSKTEETMGLMDG